MRTKYTTFMLAVLVLFTIRAWPNALDTELDVTCYKLTIAPIINQGYISGTVLIDFQINKNANSVVFNAGNLVIDKVVGEHVSGYRKMGADLIIDLSQREKTKNEIVIEYHGNPKKGLLFDNKNGDAYTVYATSQWMVCNDSPEDKALFELDLTIPSDKSCVASGELVRMIPENGNIQYSYQQNYESPSYTYGFAIGNYNKAKEDAKGVQLNYLGRNYSSDQLKTIFKETPAMISFFEEKSGVKYDQSAYTQVLVGNHYQEMSGYSILKDGYGDLVLKDVTETNLISHELAHQWWGNRITCKNWNHFWLNEAMATFMSAAYNEHRFGKEKYQADIGSYYNVYKEIKKRRNDKPLVFDGWSNPSKDDRNIVYFKGAYVLHLLRNEMGDEKFWKAIKFYSSDYFGKSVKTVDFQRALEASSGIQLEDFFNKWIY